MARTNLAYSLVATAPSPAASGGSLIVTAGQGSYFVSNSWATVWPAGEVPTIANAEIVRITNVSSDTLTITRAQQGTSARTIVVGDQIANTITVDDFSVMESAIDTVSNALSVETANRISADDALSNQISVVSSGLSNETSARVAKDNALSDAISVVSQALSIAFASIAVVSNAVSAEASSRLSADNQLSNTISVETAARIAADNSLSDRLSILSAKLSTEISAISQSHSALSQAVSVADAALSVRIDTQSQAISALSNAHSATSARLASVMSLLDGGTTGQVLKKIDNTDFNFQWDTDLAGGSSSATVTSANISALSNRISILSAALSTQISAISQAHSALSQAVSVADAALSVRIDTQSNAISVLSAKLSTEISAISQAHSALSQAVSVLSADHLSLKDRVSALSAKLSTDLSAISQAHSALSQAVSVADAALSVRIDTQSNAISVLSAKLSTEISAISQAHSALSQAVSVLSADHLSLKDRVSALSAKLSTDLSAISQAHSALSQAVSVADAALSVRIDTQSNAISVLSAKLSTEISAISQVVSALSVRVDGVSDRLSQLTSAHNALSNVVSALSVGPGSTDQYLSLQNQDSVTVSAGAPVYLHTTVSGFGSFKLADASATSAPRHVIGLITNGSVAVSAVGTVRTRDSLSLTTAQWDAITGQTGGLSVGQPYYLGTTRGTLTGTMPTGSNAAVLVGWGVTTTEMRLRLNDTADWLSDSISVGTATAAALSNAISALSAKLSTEVSALSQVISALSQTVSLISVKVDSISNLTSVLGTTTQLRAAAGNQSISGTALVNISGLSLSVAANGIYMFDGYLMHSMSGVSVFGFGFALSGATMQNASWRFLGNLSTVSSGTGVSGLSTTIAAVGWGNESAFGSASYSVLATQGGNLGTEFKGIFALSTAGGTIHLAAKAGASGCLTMKAGCYIRAYKIG